MNINWIGYVLRTNCLLKYDIEGRTEGKIQVKGRRGRRSNQILDDVKETGGYRKLKEEALDLTRRRTPFGRGCGPVLRQTVE
jgi:hypothetical protein